MQLSAMVAAGDPDWKEMSVLVHVDGPAYLFDEWAKILIDAKQDVSDSFLEEKWVSYYESHFMHLPSTQLMLATAIAHDKHRNQVDKQGKPYLGHLLRVMDHVSEEYKPIAVLHDLLEDTDTCAIDLVSAGILPKTVSEILMLTRTVGESYQDYIQRLSNDPIARQVKIADLNDNLRDGCPESLQKRYRNALETIKHREQELEEALQNAVLSITERKWTGHSCPISKTGR